MERVMSSIILSVMVLMVQSLTTTMSNEDVIFRLTEVPGTTCGISDVVVTV